MFEPYASQKEMCRPDPEVILQRIREKKDTVIQAEALLLDLSLLPVDFRFNEAEAAVAAMLGELRIQEQKLAREELAILNQINKEAE